MAAQQAQLHAPAVAAAVASQGGTPAGAAGVALLQQAQSRPPGVGSSCVLNLKVGAWQWKQQRSARPQLREADPSCRRPLQARGELLHGLQGPQLQQLAARARAQLVASLGAAGAPARVDVVATPGCINLLLSVTALPARGADSGGGDVHGGSGAAEPPPGAQQAGPAQRQQGASCSSAAVVRQLFGRELAAEEVAALLLPAELAAGAGVDICAHGSGGLGQRLGGGAAAQPAPAGEPAGSAEAEAYGHDGGSGGGGGSGSGGCTARFVPSGSALHVASLAPLALALPADGGSSTHTVALQLGAAPAGSDAQGASAGMTAPEAGQATPLVVPEDLRVLAACDGVALALADGPPLLPGNQVQLAGLVLPPALQLGSRVAQLLLASSRSAALYAPPVGLLVVPPEVAAELEEAAGAAGAAGAAQLQELLQPACALVLLVEAAAGAGAPGLQQSRQPEAAAQQLASGFGAMLAQLLALGLFEAAGWLLGRWAAAGFGVEGAEQPPAAGYEPATAGAAAGQQLPAAVSSGALRAAMRAAGDGLAGDAGGAPVPVPGSERAAGAASALLGGGGAGLAAAPHQLGEGPGPAGEGWHTELGGSGTSKHAGAAAGKAGAGPTAAASAAAMPLGGSGTAAAAAAAGFGPFEARLDCWVLLVLLASQAATALGSGLSGGYIIPWPFAASSAAATSAVLALLLLRPEAYARRRMALQTLTRALCTTLAAYNVVGFAWVAALEGRVIGGAAQGPSRLAAASAVATCLVKAVCMRTHRTLGVVLHVGGSHGCRLCSRARGFLVALMPDAGPAGSGWPARPGCLAADLDVPLPLPVPQVLEMLTLGLVIRALLAPGVLALAGTSAGAWAPLVLCGLCPPLLGALFDRLVARQAAAERAHPALGAPGAY
jgi:hypothetical protein